MREAIAMLVGWVALSGCGRIHYQNLDGGSASSDAGLLDAAADASPLPAPAEIKTVPAEVSASDRFGQSVALSGSSALVGADSYSLLRGNAYVYELADGEWLVRDVLAASDSMPEDRFGGFVSLTNELAVLGAAGADDVGMSAGAAYVFVREGARFRELAKITEPATSDYDYLGQTVSASGRRILVGCRYCDQRGTNAGAAYLYEYDGTTLSAPTLLTASDARAGDQFGVYVAISGDVAVVSKTADMTSGVLYVYRFDGATWNEEAILTADDPGPEDELGIGLAVDGDRILAGAFNKDAATGAAYVFRHDGGGWSLEQKLTASDAAPDSWFGRNVAISGPLALVGAPHVDGETGAAYVFRYDGARWVESETLSADEPTAGDQFGYSVSVFGELAGVGCPYDDDNGLDSGAVYFYDLSR